MSEQLKIAIALSVVRTWLLSLGFRPSDDWDPSDPGCLCDYGPHRVITVQAHIPAGASFDCDDLLCQLDTYLDAQAQLPGSIRLHAYDIASWCCPCCGGLLFASIFIDP